MAAGNYYVLIGVSFCLQRLFCMRAPNTHMYDKLDSNNQFWISISKSQKFTPTWLTTLKVFHTNEPDIYGFLILSNAFTVKIICIHFYSLKDYLHSPSGLMNMLWNFGYSNTIHECDKVIHFKLSRMLCNVLRNISQFFSKKNYPSFLW